MKEGFLIGGSLMIAGIALQLSAGPVVWKAFAWPVNGIVMAVFLAVMAAIFLLRKKVFAFQFVSTYQAAIPAMLFAVVLTVIMGLTRQEPNGTWLNDMLTFWPFVLIYVYVALILGLVVLRQLKTWAAAHFSLTAFRFSLLSHLGLFLALTCATLGNADMQRGKMVTAIGEKEWRALDTSGAVKEMPFSIELKKFIMETYEDGSPKRFASDILIQTKSDKTVETIVDVNKPAEIEGWKIYQFGYDTQMGAQSQVSILELVSDPWLPLVYAGIYMMLAGAVCMFVTGRPRTSVKRKE